MMILDISLGDLLIALGLVCLVIGLVPEEWLPDRWED